MPVETNPFDGLERLPSTWINGVQVAPGSLVRLHPSGRADILDLALRGRSAAVESIEVDFEGRVFVAVTLDDDPGRDLGRLGQPGHRFYYRADEVEPLDRSERTPR
jgi:hypothetical protein